MSSFRCAAAIVVGALVLHADLVCLADEQADKPASSATANDDLYRRKLDYFRTQVRRQKAYWADAPEEPFELVDEPMMRFANPVSRIADGLIFLWTDGGRPVAAMKSYINEPNKSWGRTFASLGMRPLKMEIAGHPPWTPTEAAVIFRPLPDAPVPAANPRLRLVQMRALAERFKVIDHWGKENPSDWELRLLPRPLHRYAVPDEEVVDGALFGYVLTTSPEAAVLLEARPTAAGPRWHYAVARLTVFQLRFHLDGREIAEFPRLKSWPATGTYHHIPVPFDGYPFEADAAGDPPTGKP